MLRVPGEESRQAVALERDFVRKMAEAAEKERQKQFDANADSYGT